ncbi:hypothetical protein OGZ02_05730 [Brachyspira hyodysenteriae]|nr:hypothetical protein [Brachyspira hyodysenteriae]MDA1468355.1 hypothetical protein [Brachyspira hyodysenteriae]
MKKAKNFIILLGFNLIGTYHNVGYKNNNWYNVGLFEKEISKSLDKPKDIINIKDIENEKLTAIINNFFII